MSCHQSFDFFVGGVHWFEGIFVFVISAGLILLALGEVFESRVVTHHSREILLIGLVPFFLLTDGITRLHMVMRERMRMSFGQTLKVLGMWFAVKFSNAFAALKSFIGFTMPFVRTPKAPDERMGRAQALSRSVKAAPFESVMAAIIIPVTVLLGVKLWAMAQAGADDVLIRGFLFVWIFYYALFYLAAPLYAYKSYVTFTPDRETEGASRVSGPAPAG